MHTLLKFYHFSAITLIAVTSMAYAAPKKQPATGASFYKRSDIFAFRPKENRKGQTIDRFGPVGIGIELTLPAFGMKIRTVEKGSPAEATGKLKAGQIIHTINGTPLADIDPRIQLGNMITEAESKDGKVVLVVSDKADAPKKTVTVTIPKLGKYGKDWPLDCEKSDKIVSGLADFLRTKDYSQISHSHGPAMLYMLSTGEEKDLAVATKWATALVERHKNDNEITVHNWATGYSGTALCEYYLRTGDASVIPTINKLADCARWGMYNNGWAHGTYQGQRDRTKAHMAFPYMGGGHINACGVPTTTFLLMAKECGADVDEKTLQSALRQFYRYAGRGNVAYGDQIPEQSFVDNGKTGALAFTMAAAASLTPDGERSLYAKARDISAVKGFYSTSWMLIGHTGGGVGEIWRSYSMGLMQKKTPLKHREFMNNRTWFYELSRRYDGSFGVVGGGRYDQPDSWGIMMGMTYTAPRKTLRLTGAKKTTFSNSYTLPKRPWGTPADDAFCSLEPAIMPDGSVQDINSEVFAKDASRPAFGVMSNPDVDDKILLKYAHHPDHGIRRGAASYISRHNRDHLIPVLLRSKDPRVRHAGTMVIYCVFKRRPIGGDRVTDEMTTLLGKIVTDPEESWWAVENALKALSLGTPDQIRPYADRLIHWLKHDEWWLSAAAMAPLSKIAGEKLYYKQVLSELEAILSTNTHLARMGSAHKLIESLKDANPKVRETAVKTLCNAYASFPTADEIHGPTKINMDRAENKLLLDITSAASQIPGGLNALYPVARKRFPDNPLPQASVYVRQKGNSLAPVIRKAVEEYKKANPPKKKK